jgi:hypothetical protein
MNTRIATVLVAATSALAQQAVAHHSFAMFDNQKNVTLEGTVKEFQWTNPHCWLRLVVTDPTGNAVEWNLEGQSPNGWVRQGWTRNSVQAGDKAEVVIHPLKDGSHGGSVVRVSVNGQRVGNGGPAEPSAPAPELDPPVAR